MSEALKEQDAPSWVKFVTNFDETAKLFSDNYEGLKAQRTYIERSHPDLLPKYNELMEAAKKHSSVINYLRRIRSTVGGWLGTIGRTVGLGEMGALPIVPIAVISASTALVAISKWVKDAFVFSRRLNELRRLEGQGLTPKQASDIVNKTLGPAENFLFGINLKWVVAAGIGLLLLPSLIASFRR